MAAVAEDETHVIAGRCQLGRDAQVLHEPVARRLIPAQVAVAGGQDLGEQEGGIPIVKRVVLGVAVL